MDELNKDNQTFSKEFSTPLFIDITPDDSLANSKQAKEDAKAYNEYIQDLLARQRASFGRLLDVYRREMTQRNQLSKELAALEVKYREKVEPEADIEVLRREIAELKMECEKLSSLLAPLEETAEPPRTSQSLNALSLIVGRQGSGEEGEELGNWSCSGCTFSNHPALRSCEICCLPRILPPGAGRSISYNPTLLR